MPMNPNAGLRTALTGLVSQVLEPGEGPKSKSGYPQYQITVTKATNYYGDIARPAEEDVNVTILEGFESERRFAQALQSITGTLSPKVLEGKWVRIGYIPRPSKDGREFFDPVLDAVSSEPL